MFIFKLIQIVIRSLTYSKRNIWLSSVYRLTHQPGHYASAGYLVFTGRPIGGGYVLTTVIMKHQYLPVP